MKVLVTGVAGFVGSSVARALIERGEEVVGIDSFLGFYDPRLKEARLARLEGLRGFSFLRCDVSDPQAMDSLVLAHPDIKAVVHMAAQAGVRHSQLDPCAYVQANVMGQVVLTEACRRLGGLRHLVYASSSSVYGRNRTLPFRETDRVDEPSSIYAATKRAGELAATTYAYLYGIPQTGLRFFTVYGPWGRPDMAYYRFARAISEGRPVTLYDGAALSRDFTYIDDIVEGVLAVLDIPPPKGENRLLNLGGDRPEPVSRLIGLLEDTLDRKAVIELLPRPAADVEVTWAGIERIRELTGWSPRTRLEQGIENFSIWFQMVGRNFSKI